MSSGATTWLTPPEVKMEQEEIEEWITPEIPSEGIMASHPPPTMGHFLKPFSPAGMTSRQDENYQKQDGDQQDHKISNDETESSSGDDDDESGVDEVSPPESPSDKKPPTISTPRQGTQKRSSVTRNFGLLDELITTLSVIFFTFPIFGFQLILIYM